MKPQKILVAVTGASGSLYGKLLLEWIDRLSPSGSELYLVFSDAGREVWKYETKDAAIPSRFIQFNNNDFYATFASGSNAVDTMIICPCSMGTVGRIAGGISGNLICRAADVSLKERKKLIIVPRETPFNNIHIRNLEVLSGAGAVIVPACPSFYSLPATIEELAMTVTDRVLDLAGLPREEGYKWGV